MRTHEDNGPPETYLQQRLAAAHIWTVRAQLMHVSMLLFKFGPTSKLCVYRPEAFLAGFLVLKALETIQTRRPLQGQFQRGAKTKEKPCMRKRQNFEFQTAQVSERTIHPHLLPQPSDFSVRAVGCEMERFLNNFYFFSQAFSRQ